MAPTITTRWGPTATARPAKSASVAAGHRRDAVQPFPVQAVAGAPHLRLRPDLPGRVQVPAEKPPGGPVARPPNVMLSRAAEQLSGQIESRPMAGLGLPATLLAGGSRGVRRWPPRPPPASSPAGRPRAAGDVNPSRSLKHQRVVASPAAGVIGRRRGVEGWPSLPPMDQAHCDPRLGSVARATPAITTPAGTRRAVPARRRPAASPAPTAHRARRGRHDHERHPGQPGRPTRTSGR